ncbi:MAG: phospho-N-acetylmuramoyl-pentapeptide-transferase [Enterobacteriaceae bacterium]
MLKNYINYKNDLSFYTLVFLSSFFLTLMLGKVLIYFFKKNNFFQSIRNLGLKSTKKKKYTPTMGGFIFLIPIIVSLFIWINKNSKIFYLILFSIIGFSLIGFIDDYKKITNKKKGLNCFYKYIFLSIISSFIVIIIYKIYGKHFFYRTILPSLRSKVFLNGKYLCLILSYFTIVGMSNAINLTDGLDGLVSLPIIFIYIFFFVTSFMYFNNFIELKINNLNIECYREIMVISLIIIGSILGFIWFNFYPAKIFMGDLGSLSIGGCTGVISVILRHEIFLLIVGGLFFIETLSVIVQVFFFKIFKKRVFLIAPIHHHYEKKLFFETTIVIRAWIISLIFLILCINFL